jgi:hypothetical protein
MAPICLKICPVAPEGWHTKGQAKKIVSTAHSRYITMCLRILSHSKHHIPRPDMQPGTTQTACTTRHFSAIVVTSPQARRRARPVARAQAAAGSGAPGAQVWHVRAGQGMACACAYTQRVGAPLRGRVQSHYTANPSYGLGP